MDANEAFLALSLLPGLGSQRMRALVDTFEDPLAILAAKDAELRPVIGPKLAKTVTRWEKESPWQEELALLRERGWDLVSWADERYPEALRHIPAPPVVLSVWGTLEETDRFALAVVGTRRMSMYGREAAQKLTFSITRQGYTVVSGLAHGIDTVAHESALAAGGRTLAVLGSGLDRLYPPENAGLAERIAENGAVLSQFPCRTAPDPRQFPYRNHTVTGMSLGVLVVEGNVRSGSMLSAQAAMEQGRQVFAVPGPIDRPGSAGPHALIQDGAKLVTCADDIFSELEYEGVRPPSPSSGSGPSPATPDLEGDEQLIYTALESGPLGIEALAQKTDLPSSRVSSTLLRLEMRRLVRKNADMTYSRSL